MDIFSKITKNDSLCRIQVRILNASNIKFMSVLVSTSQEIANSYTLFVVSYMIR